ncbi:hypothetical protein [Marinobacter daepoensis]|uniref:hypothetical protein n=1 Tax=Marinobacter daepoensis TaxID=262077 RepID=UPI000400E05D|nr:hypothetical protein [Marinobacter daepoensis]
MRQDYQTQYRGEVEALAEKGFEVYLLDGAALRSRGNVGDVAMPSGLKAALADFCRGSLALSEFSADMLVERDGKQRQEEGVQRKRLKLSTKIS